MIQYEVLIGGMVVVWYFGRLIAIVDEKGSLYWRDQRYPIWLVEYLVNQPNPVLAIWN